MPLLNNTILEELTMDNQYSILSYKYQTLKVRLEALENIVESLGIGGGYGPQVDPSPEDWGRNLTPLKPSIKPKWSWPPVADPAPQDWMNVRLVDVIRNLGGGAVDPSPEDLGKISLKDAISGVKIPEQIWDPAPDDIRRMGVVELKNTLASLKDTKVKVTSLEKMVNEQIKELNTK